MIETCLLKSEVISALRNTVHVSGIDSEVHTDGVSLNDRGSWLLVGGLLCSVGVMSLRDGVGIVVRSRFVNCLVSGLMAGGVMDTQVLGIVVEVVVVVDNDGLVAIDVLNNSEWVKLDLVGNLVLTADEDSVVEDLNEVLHVLLDLDLIPIDTDAGVGDGEALLFIGSLNLDLHDALLEESHVEVEVSSAELHRVSEVLVLVQVESGLDGVLVDHQAVWLDVVSSHQVVALQAVLVLVLLAAVVLVVLVTSVLVMVASEQMAEALAVVFDTAGLVVFAVELVVAVVAI